MPRCPERSSAGHEYALQEMLRFAGLELRTAPVEQQAADDVSGCRISRPDSGYHNLQHLPVVAPTHSICRLLLEML